MATPSTSTSTSSSAPVETATATEVITRTLFTAEQVYIYSIPPLQSNKGHLAATWTSSPANEIFTARLQIIETSDPNASASAPATLKPTPRPTNSKLAAPKTSAVTSTSTSTLPSISISILLTDPATSTLFAGAPYTSPSVVEPTIDSSRFFALHVTDDSRRKAVLGVGFEERSSALDFGIALQQARKILGMSAAMPNAVSPLPKSPSPISTRTPMNPRTPGLSSPRNPNLNPRGAGGTSLAGVGTAVPARGRAPVSPSAAAAARTEDEGAGGEAGEEAQPSSVKREWALKPGQMIHVDIGGKKGGHGRGHGNGDRNGNGNGDGVIEPPSGGGITLPVGCALLPPPPPAHVKGVYAERVVDEEEGKDGDGDGRAVEMAGKSLEELGFDDGEFGEFQ